MVQALFSLFKLYSAANHLMSYLFDRDLASARAFVNSELVDEYKDGIKSNATG